MNLSTSSCSNGVVTSNLENGKSSFNSKLFKLKNARNLFKFFTKTKSKQELISSSSSSTTSSNTNTSTNLINSESKDLVALDSLSIIKKQNLQRLKLKNSLFNKYKQVQIRLNTQHDSNYGFTVLGYCPCQIGKIEHDSIAETSGLIQGDLIIKINGKNVSRATCDSIVKLIKTSAQPLVLDLARPVQKLRNNYQKITTINYNQNSNANTTTSSCSKQHHYVVNSTENDFNNLHNEYNHLNQIRNLNKKRVSKVTTTSIHYQKFKKYTPKKIKKTSNRNRNSNYDYSISINNTMPSPIPHMSPLLTNNELSSQENNKLVQKKSSIIDSDYKTQSSTTENDPAMISSNSSHSAPNSESNPDEHLPLCEKLLNLEEKFIDLMQKGVQQYSRPLRHCMMINTVQHYTLFQNIEKLLAISEYQLNQLISQDDSILLDMFNTIGKLYENKMRMSCEAFDIYLNGIEKSFDLLLSLLNWRESNSNPNLAKFLYDSQEDIDMDLKTFLLLPIYYVGEIYECLKEIKEKTSKKSSDYIFLNSLCTNLEAYVIKSSDLLIKYNNGHAKNPLRNLDQDFEEIDDEEEVKTENNFQLLYSSNIQYRQSCHKWKRVKLLFFEDRIILLSYHSNVDKFISLLKSKKSTSILDTMNEFTFKSIMFKDILNVDFDFETKKQFEFNINYCRSITRNGYSNLNYSKKHTIKLKCSSLDDKFKWNKLFSKYLN